MWVPSVLKNIIHNKKMYHGVLRYVQSERIIGFPQYPVDNLKSLNGIC